MEQYKDSKDSQIHKQKIKSISTEFGFTNTYRESFYGGLNEKAKVVVIVKEGDDVVNYNFLDEIATTIKDLEDKALEISGKKKWKDETVMDGIQKLTKKINEEKDFINPANEIVDYY